MRNDAVPSTVALLPGAVKAGLPSPSRLTSKNLEARSVLQTHL